MVDRIWCTPLASRNRARELPYSIRVCWTHSSLLLFSLRNSPWPQPLHFLSDFFKVLWVMLYFCNPAKLTNILLYPAKLTNILLDPAKLTNILLYPAKLTNILLDPAKLTNILLYPCLGKNTFLFATGFEMLCQRSTKWQFSATTFLRTDVGLLSCMFFHDISECSLHSEKYNLNNISFLNVPTAIYIYIYIIWLSMLSIFLLNTWCKKVPNTLLIILSMHSEKRKKCIVPTTSVSHVKLICDNIK